MPDDALHIDILDYEKIRDAFCTELTLAARGEKTSLPFILNQLPTTPLVQVDEIFQVFVIGGTNGEAATVRYNADGTVTIVDYQAQPELAKFKTAEDFLGFVDVHVSNDTRAIGINFAVALQPKRGDKGQLDGVLIEGETKGHGFKGLQQERVGQTIEKYFKQKRGQEVIASVGNDTVCLIASKAVGRVDRTNLVAGIVGTGYNMAFFMDDGMIVNVQASDFTGFTPSATGRVVDRESTNPGEQLFDKEVAKLYKHYNVLADELSLTGGKLQAGIELGVIARSNNGKEGEIARALLRRSASLVAAQFAGFYNFKGKPERLVAVMQGGLYWEGPNYKEMVLEELKNLGVPGDAFVFEKVNRSDIIGAAMLLTGGL